MSTAPSASEVSIASVDLLADKNEERCHTDDYESEKYLIVRRGEDIHFQVSREKEREREKDRERYL